MDDPVQDRIRQGRILETPMPFRHGKLCRKQRGFVSKSIIHQIGETTCYFRADRLPEPVIYDKQIPCGEFSDKEARNRQKRSFLRLLSFLAWSVPKGDDHGSISNGA